MRPPSIFTLVLPMYSPLIAEPSAALAPIRSHGRCISPHVLPDDELSVASRPVPPKSSTPLFVFVPLQVGLVDHSGLPDVQSLRATNAIRVRPVLPNGRRGWESRRRGSGAARNTWPVNWRSGGSHNIGLRDAGVVVRRSPFCFTLLLFASPNLFHSLPPRARNKTRPRRSCGMARRRGQGLVLPDWNYGRGMCQADGSPCRKQLRDR